MYTLAEKQNVDPAFVDMNAKERSSGSFLSGIMRRPKGKKRERPKSCNLDLSVEEDAATPQGFWRSASSRWSMMRRSKSQTNVNKGEKKYEAQRSSMGCFIEETEWEPFVRRDIRGDPRGCITPIANTAYGLEYSCNHNVTNGVMISKAAAAKDVMISHSCEDKVGLASLNGAARQSAGPTKTAADTSKATVKSCHAKKEVSKAAQPTHTLHYDVKESTVKQLKRERTPPEDAQLEELDDVQSPDDVHLDILALCEKYSPVATDAVSTEAELLPPADSQDSGFQEVPNPPTSTLEDKDARSMEDTQCPIAASLSFPSEDSDDDSDSFYRKVVVRKSRSYHDLVRKRSRSKSRSSQMESSGGSHDMKWRMMRSYDSSSAGFSDLHSPHANALVVSDRSRKQSMPPPQTVVLRRAGSLDSVSTAGDVKQRDLNQLQRRSMVVPDAVDYDAVCVQPTRRTRMGRHSKSTGNVPAASRRKQKNVSMAASAAYIPGVSLSDKLRLAASKGQVGKIKELIAAGANFTPDREGRTALHYASLNGSPDAVRTLLFQGCDVNAQDALGYTALHRAAAQGHVDVIGVLATEGCVIDRQDDVHGNAALHEAAWNGYSRTLDALIRHKANIHTANKAGFSSLHLAAQNGHNQSSRVLLYAGCNANHKNNYGDTPLHTAARYGHAGVTRILISAHCRINEQNKNGDTGLHISAALKRRKITKLLVDAGINVASKNKQNETAADIAKRKEHTDVLEIINNQPKEAKKKAKAILKGDKKIKPAEEEKKEKKSFFFSRKKSKKEKEKEEAAAAAAVAPSDIPSSHSRPSHHIPGHGTLASSLPPPSAPSEISSADFNGAMNPDDLLKGYRQQLVRQQQSSQLPQPKEKVAQSRGTSTKLASDKLGLLSSYSHKHGTQYYKDLAGNVREGPIGFAPVCKCAPQLKKLEKKIDSDRHNLYDHIDTSQRNLTKRIDGIDHRTAQQMHVMENMTRERINAECRAHDELIQQRTAEECLQIRNDLEQRQKRMGSEMKVLVDARCVSLERRYDNHAAGCDWCKTDEQPQEKAQPHYHRDDMLNLHFSHETEDPPPPGRLFRSRSDDTLSMASSHPSRRHWKMKGSSRDVAALKVSTSSQRASRIERKMRHKARKEAQQDKENRQISVQDNRMPIEVDVIRKDSVKEIRVDQPLVVQDNRMHADMDIARRYGSLPRRRGSDATSTLRTRGSSVERMLGQTNQVQVSAQVHQPLYQTKPSTYAPPLPPPRSVSHAVGLDTIRTTDVNQNFPIYTSQQQRCPSPERVITRNHSKGDAGSNPDSGYGSRIYGIDPKTGRIPSSAGSSFQSNSSLDPQNTSHNTSNGSSPGFYYTDHHRFRQPIHTSPASPPSMPASVRDWFSRHEESPSQQFTPSTPQYYTGTATVPSIRQSINNLAFASPPRKESAVEIGKATQV